MTYEEGINSLFILFFAWWYGYLPKRFFRAAKALLIEITDLLSVKLILPTLFAPWKRDVVSTEGLSLQEKFSVLIMNLVSRFIGFIIKTVILFCYVIFLAASVAIFAAIYTIWFVFPLLVVWLAFLSFVNLIK